MCCFGYVSLFGHSTCSATILHMFERFMWIQLIVNLYHTEEDPKLNENIYCEELIFDLRELL